MVRLTINGKPFGAAMNITMAMHYIERTRGVISGLQFEWVMG